MRGRGSLSLEMPPISICLSAVALDAERSGHLEWRLYLPVPEYECCVAESPAASPRLPQIRERKEASFDLAKVNAALSAPGPQPIPRCSYFGTS